MKTTIEHTSALSHNALRVLESRYLLRDGSGSLAETPQQLFQRVAKAVAQAELTWGTLEQAEKWEEIFFKVIHRLDFLPNSPTLMNAGRPAQQLSACFVLPVEDSLEDIFSILKLSALIQQSGGGTGFNFSHLRPKGDPLDHFPGDASGPVAFMKIFDTTTEHIKQGGKRRGANMGILNIGHPDIEEFVESKSTEGNFRNFNISIGMTDAFMEAMLRGDEWPLIHPNTGMVMKKIDASKLWNSIIANAWGSGDPGLIFLDAINATNPTPILGKIEATNPCGEVPLLPYESCNLGSVNLSKFVTHAHSRSPHFDWNALEHTIAIAVRFLDNVIEVNHYLSPEIKALALGNRKIGLGVMGWAEALSQLGIPYASAQAVALAEQLMQFIAEKSRLASARLAKQRGTFPNWRKSSYYPNMPLRNATRTSIAPTGTISIIADTSSSIEPFFALAYQRHHVLQEETLSEINKGLLSYLAMHGQDGTDILMRIMQTGTLENVTTLSQEVKSLFKTAHEIAPDWHLKHQIAFQKYTDNAVSKTVNLPEGATRSDIEHIYLTAWREQLKGITIFRNNSRGSQVMKRGIQSEVRGCKLCLK